MNPYQVLGIAREAGAAEIKAVYRTLVKTCHPDVEGGSAEKFAPVQLAYDVLSDVERRKLYDETGVINELSPNNGRAQILEIVIQAFDAVMGEIVNQRRDPAQTDVVKAMRTVVERAMAASKEQQANIERNCALLKKVQQRLRRNGDGDDPIGPLLNGRFAEMDRALQGMKEKDAKALAALEIIDAYSFEVDQAPQFKQTFNQFGGFNSASTSA